MRNGSISTGCLAGGSITNSLASILTCLMLCCWVEQLLRLLQRAHAYLQSEHAMVRPQNERGTLTLFTSTPSLLPLEGLHQLTSP